MSFNIFFFSPVAPTNLDVVGEAHSPPELQTGVVDLEKGMTNQNDKFDVILF